MDRRALSPFLGRPAVLALLALGAGLLPTSAAFAQAPSFTLVGFPSDFSPGSSGVFGLSADGRSAAGFSTGIGQPGFLWTADGGRNDFGRIVGAGITKGWGISGNGLTVVGGGQLDNSHAFSWSQSGGYHDLGTLPGYTRSEAIEANNDGSIIVGNLSNGTGSTPQAFRWTASGGMQGLGFGTRVAAISGNGSVIVGVTGPSNNRPFTWTQANGLQFLSTLDGTGSGYATGVNSTGSILVGRTGTGLRGTMWIGGVPMDLTAGSTTSNFSPGAVSDDGSVAAGLINLGGGNTSAGVWTPGTGMMKLSDYLTANGVTVPTGLSLFECTAISADGKTFAGNAFGGGFSPQGFVATIATPCPADLDNDGDFANGGARDRAVTIEDLLYFLTGFEAGNLAVDLDNGTATGTHDGAVTVEDLLYFLSHFEAGC